MTQWVTNRRAGHWLARQKDPQHRTRRWTVGAAEMGHVWTVPAVQEESDFSAKRSGAAMYTACFRLEAYLHGDAAAVAAGPDVIR